MMPSRSALLILTCMTCLGTHTSVGAQVMHEEVLLQIVTGIKTTTPNLLANLSGRSLVVQAAPATPTQKPTPTNTIPGFDKQQKAKNRPKPSFKLGWLFWALLGIALLALSGGLLYVYWKQQPDEEMPVEPPIADEPTQLSDLIENVNDGQNLHPAVLDNNNNGKSSANPFTEPVETTPQPQTTANGNGSAISTASEKQPEELTPQPDSEALEVRETTRLAKINIIDELIKDLQNPAPTKRHKAIWELAQRGDSRAIQPLVELLMEADSKQRSLILEALSQIGTRTLKPMNRALAISLQDENAEVRKNAIRDLTRVYDLMAQVSQLLRHAVEDPDVEVQETARWALSQLNRIKPLPGADNWPNSGASPPRSPEK